MPYFNLEESPIPIDRTAVNVVYKSGEHYQFRHKSTEKCSSVPLPVRQVPNGTDDFTGYKKGSLTVVGMYNGPEVGGRPCGRKRRTKPQGHGWVCSCSCGNYTVRRTKSIKKDAWDGCIECTHNKNRRDKTNLERRLRTKHN